MKWQAPESVRTVNVQVSWNAGLSWQNLASLPAKTPVFFWYVPADQAFSSTGVLLRVSNADDPTNTAVKRLAFHRP